jgi:hypothetical protein
MLLNIIALNYEIGFNKIDPHSSRQHDTHDNDTSTFNVYHSAQL